MSLVDDIRAGSSDAIKQLYQENAQDVYDFAKGITNNHETAMQATKSTLSKLVQQIQDGSEPANLHSEALKLAYDEACKIAMPSVQNIKSPYDEEAEEEPAPAPKKPQAPVQEAPQKEEYYEERYGEEEYEEVPRAPRRGNNSSARADERDRRGSRDARAPRDGRDPRDARDPRESRDPRDRRDPRDSRDPRDRAPAPRGNRPQPARRNPRDEYYEEDYDRRYDRYDDYEEDYDYDDYEGKPKHGAGFYVCLVINIILVLILIWFLIGLLMNLGVLPDTLQSTLGYDWFNNTIYQLF